MATLTATQLARLRVDVGDVNVTPAFSDAELQDNWDRVSGAPNENRQHEATLALCYRQLLAQANKFHNYTAGAVTENLQQVRDNLKDMYLMYEAALENALGQSKQISIGKLGKRINPERTIPTDDITRRDLETSKTNRLQ